MMMDLPCHGRPLGSLGARLLHQLLLLLLLFSISSLEPCEAMHEGCVWSVATVSSRQLNETTLSLLSNEAMLDVTEQIDIADLSTYQTSETDPANEGSRARGSFLMGRRPVLHLCSTPAGQMNTATVCKEMGSMVQDLLHVSGEAPCVAEVCRPFWITPLPWDKSALVMRAEMNTELSPELQLNSLTVSVSGYVNLSETPASQASTGKITLFHIPTKSPTLILGPVGSSNSLYFSNDDFMHFKSLKVSGLPDSSAVCGCAELDGGGSVLASAAMIDRLVLLTKTGLYEVLGDYAGLAQPLGGSSDSVMPDVQSWRLALANCSMGLSISNQPQVELVSAITVLGACDSQNKVFRAKLLSGKPLTFAELLDGDSRGACDVAASVHPELASCRLESCSTTAISGPHTVCVAALTLFTATLAILSFDGDAGSGNWTIMAYIPLTIPGPEHLAEPLATSLFSSYDATSSDLLVTSGITQPPHVSRHVYLWGSHVMYSPDHGYTFYLMPWSFSNHIATLSIGTRGFVVMVTQEDEVYVSSVGSSARLKLYPSDTWTSTLHAAASQLHWTPSSNFSFVSAFFDSYDHFQFVVRVDEDAQLRRLSVPVEEMLQQLQMQHLADEAALDLLQGAVLEQESSNHLGIQSPCVFSSILFETSSQTKYTRAQMLTYNPPPLLSGQFRHPEEAWLVYHSIIENLEAHLMSYDSKYVDSNACVVSRWKDSLDMQQPIYYQREMAEKGYYVDLEGFQQIYENGDNRAELPATIYLGKGDNYTFSVYLKPAAKGFSAYSAPVSLDSLQLSAVTSSDMVQVHLDRWQFPYNNTVKYQITISERGVLTGLAPPGFGIQPASVQLEVAGAALQCFQDSQQGIQAQGMYIVPVLVGCSPAQHVMFDWQSAKDKLNETGDLPVDCLVEDPLLPCFYFLNPFYPFFRVYDDATGTHHTYEGNYTLKVIGGSLHGPRDIQHFTDEEVLWYNSYTEVDRWTSVWNAADDTVSVMSGWPVYNHLQNGITWLCQQNSPCASVMPTMPLSPEYYFLVEFSNKAMDEATTYCEFTLYFVLHIHGLPVSLVHLSLLVVLCSIVAIWCYVFLYYFCHRKDSMVWSFITRNLYLLVTRKVRMKIHPHLEQQLDGENVEQLLRKAIDASEMAAYDDDGARSVSSQAMQGSLSRVSEEVRVSSSLQEDVPADISVLTINNYVTDIIRSASVTIQKSSHAGVNASKFIDDANQDELANSGMASTGLDADVEDATGKSPVSTGSWDDEVSVATQEEDQQDVNSCNVTIAQMCARPPTPPSE